MSQSQGTTSTLLTRWDSKRTQLDDAFLRPLNLHRVTIYESFWKKVYKRRHNNLPLKSKQMFNNFDFLKFKPFRKPLNISENDIYWQNLFYRPTIKQSFKRLSRNFVSLLENIYWVRYCRLWQKENVFYIIKDTYRCVTFKWHNSNNIIFELLS